jgi:RNA polymerase sigma-32 factor
MVEGGQQRVKPDNRAWTWVSGPAAYPVRLDLPRPWSHCLPPTLSFFPVITVSARRLPRSPSGPRRASSAPPAGKRGSKGAVEAAEPADPGDDGPLDGAEARSADGEDEAADTEIVGPEDGEVEPGADDDGIEGEFSAELIDSEESAAEDDSAEVVVTPQASADSAGLTRLDPLQVYMREVQRHPLLTRSEEQELAEKYVSTGDVAAAARLVTANLRLVVKIAYEYRRAFRNMMDLIQEGNIGLMQAVKRYDPYRGVKLSSYAAWWIRAYMLRYMLNNWRLVKLGTTQAQRKLFFNLNKEKARLSALGVEPTDAEVARRLGVDEKEVVEMDRRLSRGDASLDVPVGGEDGGKAVARVELLTASSPGPEQQTTNAELFHLVRHQLDRFRATLSGKDAVIFDRRMVAEDPLTLQELGDEFGVSRERVRQLEARITGKLRIFLQEALGDAVLPETSAADVGE